MARDLDGVNDRIEIPFILNPNSGPLTCVVWGKADSFAHLDDNDDFAVLVQQEGTSGRSWLSIIRTSVGVFNLRTFIGGSALDGSTNLNNNFNYNHFGVTVSSGGSGTVRTYLNGVQEATATRDPETETGAMRIGAHKAPSAVAQEWDGSVGEFAVWENAELTANEMQALANGANPNTIRPDNLKCHLPLGGNASPEADFSGNGLNGTLISAPPKSDNPPVQMFTRVDRASLFEFSSVSIINLTANQTEPGDSQVSALSNLIQLNANQTEPGDAQVASISNVIQLNANQTEPGDSQVAALSNIVQLNANQTEPGDSQVAALSSLLSRNITANQAEAGDVQVVLIETQPGAKILDQIIIGSFPTSKTISAGSNRWFYIVVSFIDQSATNTQGYSAVTYGGQSMQLIGEANSPNLNTFMQAWGINEAGISAAVGTSIIRTGGAFDSQIANNWSVKDARQDTFIVSTLSAAAASSTAFSLQRVNDSLTFYAASSDSTTIPTSMDPPIHQTFFWHAFAFTPDVAATKNVTWNHPSTVQSAHVAFNVGPALVSSLAANQSEAGDATLAWFGLPPKGKAFKVTVPTRKFKVSA